MVTLTLNGAYFSEVRAQTSFIAAISEALKLVVTLWNAGVVPGVPPLLNVPPQVPVKVKPPKSKYTV